MTFRWIYEHDLIGEPVRRVGFEIRFRGARP
jgi:hypothetical protein